jgi:hypothetical protein
MITCKFKVNTIARVMNGDKKVGATVSMFPVYSSDPNHENKKFWDATPNGKFEFYVGDENVIKELELGKEYYIDIRE